MLELLALAVSNMVVFSLFFLRGILAEQVEHLRLLAGGWGISAGGLRGCCSGLVVLGVIKYLLGVGSGWVANCTQIILYRKLISGCFGELEEHLWDYNFLIYLLSVVE